MDPRLQLRLQRYGWDLAASHYVPLWHDHLSAAHRRLLQCATLETGDAVLDVACGPGLVALAAARAVGPGGRVTGIDLSGEMVDAASKRAAAQGFANVTFMRMDAEKLALQDGAFDVALCSLGLMYMPDPARAVAEVRRVLRPGGRAVFAVWGERRRCGWESVFPIVDAEVEGDVCPLFFNLGADGTLVRLCASEGLEPVEQHRIQILLDYDCDESACRAAFEGGPIALAWSRFDASTRARVCARYIEAISRWRDGRGYRLPGELVMVMAKVPRT